jgi:cysteine-rich repeat protein
MEVERCIDLALTGCGDGKMSTRNGETCDDGNLENGDGCSNQCTVEYMWSCTQNEGQLSVCTPITCGNGKLDPNEECDDFNFLDNDGCTKCEIDLGYKCLNTTCSIACGDGKILRQYRNDPVTNTKTLLAYNEECDFVNGCNNATCKPLLGWTCTVNNSTLTSYCN